LAAALFIGHALLSARPTDSPADAPGLPAAALAAAAPEISSPLPVESYPAKVWAADRTSISTADSFAYPKTHPAAPLPATAFAALASISGWNGDEFDNLEGPPDTPIDDAGAGRLQRLSRGGLCSAIASVAQANELPITFFANLIWQESSFRSRIVSPAGALGIAQFIPQTAIEYGLMNPFEPLHALFAAGKLVRKLNDRFGNPGLAAAAYNAGPQRVTAWVAERRTLPSETRAYVFRITGRPADQWLSSEIRHDAEATLMPAKAPCAEVHEDVRAQARIVRVSKLMAELTAATAPAPDAALPVASAKPDRPHKSNERAGPLAAKHFAKAPAPRPHPAPKRIAAR
jgi:soluble lytic murein transglycosylase-like protein